MRVFIILICIVLSTGMAYAGPEAKKVVKSYADKLLVFENNGRKMQPLRGDTIKTADCFVKMHKYQPQLDKLGDLLRDDGKLPSDVTTYFSAAASKLRFCVSCREDALASCDDGHGDILKGLSIGLK